jgi:hypothetical protein
MPVHSTHPEYDANLPAWLRARDVIAGEDAIKTAGIKYLPRLDSQTDDEYAAYKMRASFFNATARTADGFIGLIFRREPTFKLPDKNGGVGRALDAFIEDADLRGTSLTSYAKNITTEVITVGRAGTLVDWEDNSEKRASAVRYTAEQIINWRSERVNGRNVLTLVVLKEMVADVNQDEFENKTIEQYRVLKLVTGKTEVSSQGRSPHQECEYVVEIWQPENKHGTGVKSKRSKAEWVKVESRTPLRLGKPLPLIPFVFHGPRHFLPDVDKLPLADIIAVNLDHYRLNADYHHGLHFTALPTAWVSGFDKTESLRIGSSTAWMAESSDAKAGYLEYTGQGLTTFERAMDRDEQIMAALGSRMLEAQKRVGETAAAIELRQSGENCVLSSLSVSLSDSLTHVMSWVYWWNSTEATPEAIGDDAVLMNLNTDFSAKGMASDQITAIVSAWKEGAISRDTMFDLFRKGEVLPVGRSNEEEAKLLKNGITPQPSPGAGSPQFPAPAGDEKQPSTASK